MKKNISCVGILLLVLSFAGIAGATSYTFTPADADLADLPHGTHYTWGMNWKIPTNETIVGASLVFKNIYNWAKETNDLYVHLFDTAAVGLKSGTDTGITGQNDYFAGKGILLLDWQDKKFTPQNVTYTFDAAHYLTNLISYISNDGNFGFGFDPRCHFYNEGISLTITTAAKPTVPEPTTLLLVGAGLLGLFGFGRKSART